LCASTYKSGLSLPRGLHIDKTTNELLLVERYGGIELSGGYLYASTQSCIPTAGQLTYSNANMVVVIDGMEMGGHPTQTLAFDSSGAWLYVSIGSENNVDGDSSRARIRRFNIANWNSSSMLMVNSSPVVCAMKLIWHLIHLAIYGE